MRPTTTPSPSVRHGKTLDLCATSTKIVTRIGDIVIEVEVDPDSWTVAQAKARLSEVIAKAKAEGPQAITRHGKSAVVVVDAALWEKIRRREQRGSFADFLLASPLRGSGVKIERLKGGIRESGL